MMDRAMPMPEDMRWKMHLESLRAQIRRNANGQCLMWINPAQVDPFEIHTSMQSRRVTIPIAHPRFDLKYAPYLVALNLDDPEDSEVFETSVFIAWDSWRLERLQAFRGQPIAGWVLTDASPKLLAQHWALYCHLHRDNGISKLLRFHDPGVREWLWPILTLAQQGQLLGPAKSLIAFSRAQQLMEHSVQRSTDVVPQRPSTDLASPIKRLALTTHQWHQVNDYAIVHGAWIGWRTSEAENGSTPNHRPDWHIQVFAALRHATSYGISAPDDRELFAAHVLNYGEQFHMNPKLQAVWDKTRGGECYGSAYEDWLDTVSSTGYETDERKESYGLHE
jgi:hypothetical protein